MSFLYWFQSLTGVTALTLIACYFIGFAWGLTWLGRRLTQRLDLMNTSSLGPSISLVATMASILIGLVIVSLWGDYRNARATVSSEAIELRGATRDVQLLGSVARPRLLADLRSYQHAVIADEWPAMEFSTAANSAGRALALLIIDADTTHTQAFDFRARVSRMSELRTTRLSQTGSGIVWVLWLALLAIPVLLLAGMALLNDANPAFHYLLGTMTAGAISIAIFTALELDLPFRGIAALSPAPIAAAIDQALSEATATRSTGVR
jgi:hypothetical protein